MVVHRPKSLDEYRPIKWGILRLLLWLSVASWGVSELFGTVGSILGLTHDSVGLSYKKGIISSCAIAAVIGLVTHTDWLGDVCRRNVVRYCIFLCTLADGTLDWSLHSRWEMRHWRRSIWNWDNEVVSSECVVVDLDGHSKYRFGQHWLVSLHLNSGNAESLLVRLTCGKSAWILYAREVLEIFPNGSTDENLSMAITRRFYELGAELKKEKAASTALRLKYEDLGGRFSASMIQHLATIKSLEDSRTNRRFGRSKVAEEIRMAIVGRLFEILPEDSFFYDRLRQLNGDKKSA